MGTQIKTIDCTPTWEALLPTLLEVIEYSSNYESKAAIKRELTRMAKIADKYVQAIKDGKITE